MLLSDLDAQRLGRTYVRHTTSPWESLSQPSPVTEQHLTSLWARTSFSFGYRGITTISIYLYAVISTCTSHTVNSESMLWLICTPKLRLIRLLPNIAECSMTERLKRVLCQTDYADRADSSVKYEARPCISFIDQREPAGRYVHATRLRLPTSKVRRADSTGNFPHHHCLFPTSVYPYCAAQL